LAAYQKVTLNVLAGDVALDDLLQLKDAELAVSVGVIDRQQKDLEASVDLVLNAVAPAFVCSCSCCLLQVVQKEAEIQELEENFGALLESSVRARLRRNNYIAARICSIYFRFSRAHNHFSSIAGQGRGFSTGAAAAAAVGLRCR
jgi:hypothetical protein